MTALAYRPKLGSELEFIGSLANVSTRQIKVVRFDAWYADTYQPDAPVVIGKNGRPRNKITLPGHGKGRRLIPDAGCVKASHDLRKHLTIFSGDLQGNRSCRIVACMSTNGRKTTPWQERFWRYITPLDDDACWEWSGSRNEHGYGRLNRGRAGAGQIKAHRASYEIHFGPFPPELQVCHKCDNPPCCNPHHLFLGTMKDNLRDAANKGRTGPQNGGSAACRKITDQQVREIRHAAVEGVSYQKLARDYGISGQQISEIALGRQRTDAGGPIAAPRRVVGVRKSR